MTDVIVAGVGLHPWGKFPHKSWVEMGAEVALGAVAEAGMEWTDVEAMVSGAMQWGGSTGMRSGNTIAAALGETGVPIANINNACASGGSLMRAAYAMITSGMHDSVLVIGTDKSPKGYFPSVPVLADEPRPPVDMVRWQVGVPNPAYWALEMRKRMETYGSTEEHLAQVKVKNSRHGSLNPYARYQKAFTMEQVLASPMVCDPLRLLEICATSDGAAAVVLVSGDKARRLGTRPLVKVAACSLASGEFGDPTIRIPLLSATSDEAATAPLLSESRLAAQKAYEQAGLGARGHGFRGASRQLLLARTPIPGDHGLLRGGRGGKALGRRRDGAGGTAAGLSQRRVFLFRRGDHGSGDPPDSGSDLAASGNSRRPSSGGRPEGHHRGVRCPSQQLGLHSHHLAV